MSQIRNYYSLILKMNYDNRSIFARLVVGLIFLSEGIQKYMFLSLLGPGRFFEIGFSHPAFWSYWTGTFEIICGSLVLLGLFTETSLNSFVNYYDYSICKYQVANFNHERLLDVCT